MNEILRTSRTLLLSKATHEIKVLMMIARVKAWEEACYATRVRLDLFLQAEKANTTKKNAMATSTIAAPDAMLQ